MSQQDPLANFLGDLAKKIKTTKEHKDIMEAVYASASGTEIVKEQEDPFAGFLKKVGKTISEKIPVKEVVEPKKETKPIVVEEIKQEIKTPEPEEKGNEPVKTLAFKIKEAIEKAKNKALNSAIEPAKENNEKTPKQEEPEDEQIAGYIDELEKIKDTGTVQQKEEAITSLKELKEYVDKTVKDYSRKILDLGSGGGTVAVQYANGGTMNGDLNINGHILSGGRNISDYFGSGGGGGGTDLSTVITYLSTTNVMLASATITGSLSVGGTIYSGNSAMVLASYTEIIGDNVNNSFNVNHRFKSTNVIVSVYEIATSIVLFPVITVVNDDTVNISFNFVPATNTYKVIVFGSIPSNQINAFGEIYTFFTAETGLGDIPFLSGNWNNTYTIVRLNSAGWESVETTVAVISGNWNSTYTTVNLNSAGWESVETSVTVTSGDWNSVYTTYKQLSASYVAETLAIAYAIAL